MRKKKLFSKYIFFILFCLSSFLSNKNKNNKKKLDTTQFNR